MPMETTLQLKLVVVGFVTVLTVVIICALVLALHFGKKVRAKDNTITIIKEANASSNRLIMLLKSRSLCLVAGLLLSVPAFSQNAVIVLRDSVKYNTVITGYSSSDLFTNAGTFKLKNVALVSFANFKQTDEPLVAALLAAKVSVDKTNSINFSNDQVIQSSIMIRKEDEPITIMQVTDGLEHFRDQRAIGKGLQIAAIIGAGVAAGVATKQDVKPAVFYALTGMYVVGLVIDIDAGKHLSIRTRRGVR